MGPDSPAYKLLGIAQSYAPTGEAQQRLANDYNAMQADGLTENDIVCAFAGLIIDGIRFGNWPWIIDPKSDTEKGLPVAADAMKPEEVKRLADDGKLHDAWIDEFFPEKNEEQRFFAKTARFDEASQKLVITEINGNVVEMNPAQIVSVRH